MNQNLYKVIFNKSTGLMTAVAEVAHNNGKGSGADSSSVKSVNRRVSNLLPTQNGVENGVDEKLSGSLNNAWAINCPPYDLKNNFVILSDSEKSQYQNKDSSPMAQTNAYGVSFGSLLQIQDCSTIGGLMVGKDAQTAWATSCPPYGRNNLSGSLKPIAATLLIAGLMGLSQHSYAEAVKTQITADKSAPKNQQAQIHKTAGGKAQVNIVTPTAKGVSMNQYSQFNVGDNDSVIINNARKAANTHTAGWINGNPNLARGEAKIIVNQVNSNDPSKLNGYIEIGGKQAELIMANPNGISVNGGGFINANKVKLVSGSVKFDDGEVKGFSVDNKNSVAINGKGMDASNTEYTQIISAASKINAEIYANNNEVQINAVSGSVDENGKGKNQGQVAVDVANLGGMYAGKITLVGNEKGFAVNNRGKLIAANNIHIDASGKVSNSKDGIVSADSVDIKAKKLEDTGVIQGKNTKIKTQEKFTITSKLVAEDKLDLQSDNGIDNKTELLSKDISLKATS
ncbi:MAG: filamentous hemagglutinin N-terminal domain-containing protein [Neisseriaceae bacterium]|nr:filamentous hemagglutinin N-terminal domain-containing protein [Neisseriaceae bacterium]